MRKKVFEDEKYIDTTDTSQWPKVLLDNIDSANREIYLTRKKAVDMYLDNRPIIDITNETGLHRNTISRLAKRCLKLDEFGKPYGYVALIPYKHLEKYKRLDYKSTNYSGKFNQLLNRYPELETFIKDNYLGLCKKSNLEPNIIISSLHKKLIRKCHDLNIKEHEYPFNTKDLCKRSLYRYIDSLKNNEYIKYTNRLNESASQSIKYTGIGEQNNPVISRPFHQVQFDGHKIDAMLCIKFETPEGDIVKKNMSRIWLLAIVDVATRVILGYHLCLNTEYSAADVLKCIENAVKPKEKLDLKIPGLKYPENGGFHSIAIPETKWAVWDEFFYDNAKANLSKSVTENLTKAIKCSVNAGPVATPQRRGIVERMFRTLEESTYHRLVSTVGTGINDPRKKNAEKSSIAYEVSESEIEQITEIAIANYNNTPHTGINGFTPLEVMKQRIERGKIPRIMDKNEREDLVFVSLKINRKIQGNIDKGKRPYIYYEGVEYRNDILAKSPSLIGTTLTILVNINDLRMVKAFLSDGSEFGILTAKGKWSLKPHTLKMRKEINELKRRKIINFSTFDDPIDVYHNYLLSKANDSKPVRNKLASLSKSQIKINSDIKDKRVDEIVKIEKKEYTTPKTQMRNCDNDKVKEIKKENLFITLNF